MKTIQPAELSKLLASAKPSHLLDVLSDQHFAKAHIPGAKNVCVYEISFLENVADEVVSKEESIVVYGLNDQFEAATMASDLLVADGYSQVAILEGGLEAWTRSSLPVESARDQTGTGVSEKPLDTERSLIRWTGRNLVNQHTGTLKVTGGFLRTDADGLSAARVETDFDTLTCTDIEDQKMNQVLLNHLKAADFFLANEYPQAVFSLNEIISIDGATAGRPNISVKGELTLRGVTQEIQFEAIFQKDDEQWVVQANLDIDRTRWNSKYGSGRFFEALGKHLVNDHISLQVQLFA